MADQAQLSLPRTRSVAPHALLSDLGVTITAPTEADLNGALKKAKFLEWVARAKADFPALDRIDIAAVKMFGPSMGFCFVKGTNLTEPPSTTFYRGNAVSILVLIRTTENKIYTILTNQPRFPACDAHFLECVAGMMDNDSNLAGTALKELKEEAGIVVTKSLDMWRYLWDRVDRRRGDLAREHPGYYPSAGGCDELLTPFLVVVDKLDPEMMQIMLDNTFGVEAENEKIKINAVRLNENQLFGSAPFPMKLMTVPDAKLHTSLSLFEQICRMEKIMSFDQLLQFYDQAASSSSSATSTGAAISLMKPNVFEEDDDADEDSDDDDNGASSSAHSMGGGNVFF